MINKQAAQVSGLFGFSLLSYSPKCLPEIYSAQYGDAIFVPFPGAHCMAAGKWLVTYCELRKYSTNHIL